MPRASATLPLLEEACADLPHTRRAMFGGHGFFAPNGGMFAAVVDEDRLAIKLPDEAAQQAFVAEGGEPWTYQGRMTMRAWLVVPPEMLDDPRALAEWCRRAHASAEPAKAKAKKGAKRA